MPFDPRRISIKALSVMETENKAFQKLGNMALADRITAVAADVDSKRDEFRSIGGHELASLLGIDDADHPGPDWSFSWIEPRRPVEDILADDEDKLLQSQLTPERHTELCSKIDLREEYKTNYAKVLKFLTDDEKQKIEEYDMERRYEDDKASACYCYAYKSVEAPNGKELTFQAFIEDDGACIELKTPYDERDGEFNVDGLEMDQLSGAA
jgi:hypothetical protein